MEVLAYSSDKSNPQPFGQFYKGQQSIGSRKTGSRATKKDESGKTEENILTGIKASIQNPSKVL